MLNWQELIAQRFQGQSLPQLPSRIQIPRPPQCIAEFLKLVDRPNTPLNELALLIEKDSEIATSVLRIVNGSQMMLRDRVSSISRAIGLLGLQRCKMLVMSAAIQASMSKCSGSQKQMRNLLLESQERALYARRVCEMTGGDPEVAYISALLQDLLLPHLMDAHSELYETYRPEQIRLVELETGQLKGDHSIFTAALLSQWNFAEGVVASVIMHHSHDEILQNELLVRSEIGAVAVSGLLPGTLQQEPRGISLLLEYQKQIPEFDFLQVAADVDEEFASLTGTSSMRTTLGDRLSRLACAAIEENQEQVNWVERTLGSYTLEEKIGQGGVGVVYRARHSMLRRPAAVKMLKTATLSQQVLERFEVEAHITSELSSPHTVQVYDYGMTSDGTLYYVMEYLKGMSLSELVTDYGPLPEDRVIHLLCQVCGSLAEAHSKGLVHRDIKAENIALTVCGGAYDFVKVLDFGLVAVKDEIPHLPDACKIMGTPAYMAPEAIQSPDLVDERTDLYALGAVAYFCITGKLLFENLSLPQLLRAQISETPKFSAMPCSEEFRVIIQSCLEKKSADRPQGVMELASQLGRCQAANSWSFDEAQQWWEEHVNSSRKNASQVLIPSLGTQLAPTKDQDETVIFGD
ncbi:protein kinase domain-containing protein [Thalassoglobus sp.]|uniref:protein kinase domain-containing protein n=1 Tax=Thalassoglobus sp. TaxID=2795869 RepID=UPI003AA9943A